MIILHLRERKIHLPNQLDDFLHRLFEANIDQQPLVIVEDEIHAAAQDFARLVVHLDDVREDRLAGEHRLTSRAMGSAQP